MQETGTLNGRDSRGHGNAIFSEPDHGGQRPATEMLEHHEKLIKLNTRNLGSTGPPRIRLLSATCQETVCDVFLHVDKGHEWKLILFS